MLATLSELKTYLGISGIDEDARLNLILVGVDAKAKSIMGRDIEASNYTNIFNGKGEQVFNVNQYPLNSITSFQYNNSSVSNPVWVSFDTDSYQFEVSTGRIFLFFLLPKGLNNIKLVYNAGYTTVPADLKLAVLDDCASMYNMGGVASGIKSESVDGARIEYMQSIPQNSMIIYEKYAVI